MSVLPIYLYGSDMLRKEAKALKELDNATIKLIYDMVETMQKSNGIGLAATQVGELKRIIVVDVSRAEEPGEEGGENQPVPEKNSGPKTFIMINPEIVEETGTWLMEEGCLSIPDVRADVERSEEIRVRFRNPNFQEEELVAEGLLARVILHEIDHLDGVLFIDHLSGAKRGLLRPKLRKIKKGDVETSYPVVSGVEV